MSLKQYHKKRDFKKTREPRGKVSHDQGRLFIIQKHDARHLHYDFRLELNGVLLSWVIPKGPCYDPSVKRLAIHVEDHPVEYGAFEGIIPKGEYGGGTVMLWDRGIWKPLDENPTQAYQKGHLHFELEAHKLQGRWDLFRFKEDEHWFLVKYHDKYAKPLSDYDVTNAHPRSVLTKQTLTEIHDNYEQVWNEERSTKAPNCKVCKSSLSKTDVSLPEGLIPAPFPTKISPQLATLVDKAPLRHPSFKGLRLDKKAKEVKREQAVSVAKTIKETKITNTAIRHANKTVKIDFTITHPEKIIYPEDKLSKQDLLEYYEAISDYILPFIKNRPLSLVRCPENYRECFFQRHFNKTTPKALKSIKTKDDSEPYIYLDDKAGLLSLVQMGVLEIHPWGSTIDRLETPDIIILDLDPAPDVTWKAIVAACFDIKTELAQINLKSFIKTTGGKGLHIVVPVEPEYHWQDVKNFTHVFVEYLEKKNPTQYISKMTKAQRGGKIFIDYLRNQRSATAISAYSTRARIHAPVCVPLAWDELTNRRSDTAFTIKTLSKRLQALPQDPWHDFWKVQQSLPRLDEE